MALLEAPNSMPHHLRLLTAPDAVLTHVQATSRLVRRIRKGFRMDGPAIPHRLRHE